MSEYADMRTLVALARINDDEDAPTCAAMISRIDKAEQRGEACPGWASLVEEVKPRDARHACAIPSHPQRFPLGDSVFAVYGLSVWNCPDCGQTWHLRLEAHTAPEAVGGGYQEVSWRRA